MSKIKNNNLIVLDGNMNIDVNKNYFTVGDSESSRGIDVISWCCSVPTLKPQAVNGRRAGIMDGDDDEKYWKGAVIFESGTFTDTTPTQKSIEVRTWRIVVKSDKLVDAINVAI